MNVVMPDTRLYVAAQILQRAANVVPLRAALMTIDWIKFVPALLLLLTPGDLFNGGKVRYREVSRDWDGFWSRALVHGLHTIDLVRAALGIWLLMESVQSATNPTGTARYQLLLLEGGLPIFAVLLQTIICREPESANAPFTFITGLLLGGSSPIPALFAIAIGLLFALGSRAGASYFPVSALVYLGVGFWFKGQGAAVSLVLGATAAVLPFLLAIMFRRDLVVAYRAKRQLAEDQTPLR